MQTPHVPANAGPKFNYYRHWLLVIERKGSVFNCWLCPSESAFTKECRRRFEPLGFAVAQDTLHRWFDLLSGHLDEVSLTSVDDAVTLWPYSGELDQVLRELMEKHEIIKPKNSIQIASTDSQSARSP